MKIKCTGNRYNHCIHIGQEYEVIDEAPHGYRIKCDENDIVYHSKEDFIVVKNFVDSCAQYAIDCHTSTSHMYGDGKPYSVHLKMVYDYGKKYLYYVPKEEQDNVLAACWVHDVIEDTRTTFNNVKEACGERVAELAYALTNEKGKNRAARGNDKYYNEMKQVPYATFVKLCDRLANVKYSFDNKSNMLGAYRKEHDSFKKHIGTEQYPDMWAELNELLK